MNMCVSVGKKQEFSESFVYVLNKWSLLVDKKDERNRWLHLNFTGIS